MSDALRLSINPSRLPVDPGSSVDLALQIENRTGVVDEFTVEVLGPAAGWATPDRSRVPLFPNRTETVTIKVQPPRTSFPNAGVIPLGIRVRSSVSPDLSAVEECRVELNPFVEVAAEIRPRTSRGRFGASHRLRIINRGNAPATVSLYADVQQGDCHVVLPDTPLKLAAGERRTTRIKVRPSETHFTGPEEIHQFRIKIEPQGGPGGAPGGTPAVTVDGSMRQRAVAQIPTTLLVTAALVLGAAYVVYGKGLNLGPVSLPRSNAVSSAPLVAQSQATVSGLNFGSAPAGVADNSTNCGSYTNNGSDFGNNLWLQAGNFAAFGQGTPPTGTCVGLIITSWSNTRAEFTFGSAYRSFDHWYISAGDAYVLNFKGVQFSGTVTFPAATIQAVKFTKSGNTPPVVTVTGANFGPAPAGANDNVNGCGTFSSNGQDFGDNLWVQAGTFAAFGNGTPPTGSCVGLIVTSWTGTQIVFTFGSGYNSYDHWYMSPGDSYVLHLMGLQFTGTVSFA
ncbi:MAG: hypothetical protein E6I72_11875 [Chloroflexi bacterium]|nr:MAG: hypothetical protein E6I72_11875 [Chloroflexota bacterium]